ncbi:MAG: helix-turn-helix transcriptional regulator [Deltaproteobacteria bacterium]|nr:helix-turn-helix transcriptional regulator [Deltaproteobacteria bacterium]
MRKEANILFWADRALYIGPDFESDLHSHYAIQISIGLSRNIHFREKTDSPFKQSRFFIIASNAPHQIEQKFQNVIILYLDNKTETANAISAKILKGRPFVSFPFHHIAELIPDISECLNQKITCRQAKIICDRLIRNILTGPPKKRSMDERIHGLLTELDTFEGDRVSVAEFAQSLGLSTSRLCHLFQKQVGLPIRQYYLWRKVIRAIMAMEHVSTLTEAAHQSGFSDSSHMNRTFKRMFGIKPSFFMHYKQAIRIINCPLE